MNQLIYTTRLPKVIPNLKQLQLAIEMAKLLYGEAAANSKAVWDMFDAAIENGNKEAKNDLSELAAYCDTVKHDAYTQLDELKRNYLSLLS